MRVLYHTYYLFFFLGSCVASFFSIKIRQGLLGRRGLVKRLKRSLSSQPKEQSKVWFHVASAGEFEQAIPLMEQLKRSDSPPFILLTYFSPSGELAVKMEAKRRDESFLPSCWDHADFSPHDFPSCVVDFIRTLKPQALILIHKEIWPNLVLSANKMGTPCFLWLTRFKQQIPWFIRPLLSYFSDIGVVDSPSFDLIKQFDPRLPVRLVGDTRLERILFRKKYFCDRQRLSAIDFELSPQSVIAASFWDEDFEVLKQALAILARSELSFPLLLVPHEPTAQRVSNWIKAFPEDLKKVFSIQIIDQVGILAELYSQASIVIVGGSFKKRVHNVLEPLVYQCMLVTGPHISNSVEACQLHEQNILEKTQNEKELASVLERLVTDSNHREGLQKRQRDFLDNYTPCSDHYLESLKIY